MQARFQTKPPLITIHIWVNVINVTPPERTSNPRPKTDIPRQANTIFKKYLLLSPNYRSMMLPKLTCLVNISRPHDDSILSYWLLIQKFTSGHSGVINSSIVLMLLTVHTHSTEIRLPRQLKLHFRASLLMLYVLGPRPYFWGWNLCSCTFGWPRVPVRMDRTEEDTLPVTGIETAGHRSREVSSSFMKLSCLKMRFGLKFGFWARIISELVFC